MGEERPVGDEQYYASFIDGYEEMRDIIQYRFRRIADYQETVVSPHVERVEDLLREVDDNWDDYRMDAYHGTQEAGVEDILETGALLPSDRTDAKTGEIPDSSAVSLTRNKAIAAFYARHAPPTQEQAQSFIDENLSHVTGYDFVPDITSQEGRDRLRKLADIHLDEKQDLDNTEEHIYNLADRIDSVGNLGGPVVIGLDDDNLVNSRESAEGSENEIHNQNIGNHLAEVQCDSASLTGGVIYVEHGSQEEYSDLVNEIGVDLDVRSLDALELRHEMEMEHRYINQGAVDMRSVWDTTEISGPELAWNPREYDDRPHRIDISGPKPGWM